MDHGPSHGLGIHTQRELVVVMLREGVEDVLRWLAMEVGWRMVRAWGSVNERFVFDLYRRRFGSSVREVFCV